MFNLKSIYVDAGLCVIRLLCSGLMLASLNFSTVAQANSPIFLPMLNDSAVTWYSANPFSNPALPFNPSRITSNPLIFQENNDPGQTIKLYEELLDKHPNTTDSYGLQQLEILEALTTLHLTSGNLEKAGLFAEKRLFLTRVINGLYHPAVIPVLQELSELASLQGKLEQAHDLQEAILTQQLRLHEKDDPALISAFIQWADWHLHWYLRTVQQDPGLHHSIQENRSYLHFHESDTYYSRALALIDKHAGYGQQRLLVKQHVKTLYFAAIKSLSPNQIQSHGLVGAYLPAGSIPGPYFDLNKVLLLLTPAEQLEQQLDAGDAEQYALELVALADWHSLFGQLVEARKRYRQAYELLANHNVSAIRIEQIMAPGLPVPDPSVMYSLRSRLQTLRQYMDVTVEIDEFGRVKNAAVSNPGSHPRHLEKILLREIYRSQHRPKFLAADENATSPVELRYFY